MAFPWYRTRPRYLLNRQYCQPNLSLSLSSFLLACQVDPALSEEGKRGRGREREREREGEGEGETKGEIRGRGGERKG